MLKFRRVLAATIVAAFCCAQTFAALHPFHVSRAEIEYNAKRKTFEVALCVWPVDLEKAVSKNENEYLDIDSLPEQSRDDVFEKYIKGKFRFVPADQLKKDSKKEVKPAAIRWVGSELTLKQAWLYFEVDAKTASDDWVIENQMFFELHDDQLNLVQIKNQRDVQTLTLTTSEPSTKWARSRK